MSTEMIAYLDFVDSKDVSHRVEIRKDKLSMGRAYGNDLRIEDTRISRNHAEIVSLDDNSKHIFRDRESKCGSFINGVKIREKVLNVGDVITLGGTHTTRLTFGYSPKLQGGLESMNTTSNALSNLDAFFGIKDSTTVITEQQTRFLNAALMQQPEYISHRTLSNLMALYQISHRILPIKNVLELAEIWLEQLFKALPVERGAIFLFNQSKNQLETIISHNQSKEKIEVSTKHPVIEHSFTNNVAVHSDSISIVEKFSKSSEFAKNVSSLLCAPISTSLRVWGVCYLDSSKKELNLEDLEFLMATARQAGLVIENLELQEQLVSSERLATIGKLTSGISHEIRNRLALLTGVEFIEMKYSHDPDVKIFTEMVKMGQQRALALVDEIRAFARNRNDEFVKSRLSIVRTIEKALSILKLDSSAMKRSIDFYYDCEPILAFNEAKIEQVIINLIRNAIEATKEDTGKIIITLTTNQAEVLIRISDNGMGIPTDTLERIWEPFFTTKGQEGTGLGLEICRRIIESHRGNIKCESQVGKGTTFIASLPVNPS